MPQSAANLSYELLAPSPATAKSTMPTMPTPPATYPAVRSPAPSSLVVEDAGASAGGGAADGVACAGSAGLSTGSAVRRENGGIARAKSRGLVPAPSLSEAGSA